MIYRTLRMLRDQYYEVYIRTLKYIKALYIDTIMIPIVFYDTIHDTNYH